MRLADFEFDLPPDRIAQHPADPRDAARFLVLDRTTGVRQHRVFRDLPAFLARGDLLVLNDTKVVPARLFGMRSTGGHVECLLVRERGRGLWEALLRAGGRLRPGERLTVARELLTATLIEKMDDGTWLVALEPPASVLDVVASAGEIPLPPYIARDIEPADRSDYQTVFARVNGAVAAPTAGLHFTPELLATLGQNGVERAFVTLHVGPGTFRPIAVEDPRRHRMHAEAYSISEGTLEAIRRCRSRGRRIVACGTTVVRALETYAASGVAHGDTSIFLYPGHRFRLVDALITNFHLPRSSLLLLVAAFADRETLLDCYREALARAYRFYSYGDAMLIL